MYVYMYTRMYVCRYAYMEHRDIYEQQYEMTPWPQPSFKLIFFVSGLPQIDHAENRPSMGASLLAFFSECPHAIWCP